MKQVHRLSGLLGLLGFLALSGCGGGGSSSVSSATSSQDNFAGGGNNVVPMTVEAGPAAAGYQPFNQPLVSVKICASSSGPCGTVSGILVDTGSYGLRVMASALTAAGVTLPAMADPIMAGNTIQECLPFADGYAWGAVSLAQVSVGGETTSGTVPIQVIDDSTPAPAVPPSCASYGDSLGSVADLGANGILGVGVLASDCGSYCAKTPSGIYDIYYSCPSSGPETSCPLAAQSVANQVTNPVADFPTDNNGVILQLPAISSAGSPMTSGYLVFGIGTETNNALGSARVLTANDDGNFTTNFNGPPSLTNSFIDSGSNALFFNDNSLTSDECDSDEFYCPPSVTTLTASNEGENGTTSDVSFSITNLNNLSGYNFALDDVGGPAPPINNWLYFDWGVPFFYGRTIFFALAGANAGGATGPYYAY